MRSARGAGAGDTAGTLHRAPPALAQRDAAPHGLSPASRRTQHPRELPRAPHGRMDKGRLAEHPAQSPRGPAPGPTAAAHLGPPGAGLQRGEVHRTEEQRDRRQRDRPAAAGAAERGEETKDSRAISARPELVNRAPGPRGAEQLQPSTPLPEPDPERGSFAVFPPPLTHFLGSRASPEQLCMGTPEALGSIAL